MRTFHRFLSVLLTLALLFSCIPVSVHAATPVWDWEGYTPISTQQELLSIKNDLSGKYYLTQNITLSGTFSPIGSSSSPFTGILDGNGYSIKNMNISHSSTAMDRGIGLFAANSGTIRNLTMDSATITVTSRKYSSKDPRFIYVGMIAGINNGEIVNCTVKDNSIISATIYSNALIGGITGDGSAVLCTNNAPITISSVHSDYRVPISDTSWEVHLNYLYVGGITGGGKVFHCANNGNITCTGVNNEEGTGGYFGGISGRVTSSGTAITDCINTGAISIYTADATDAEVHVGGIVGDLWGSYPQRACLSRCENTGSILVKSGRSYIGGIAGDCLEGNISECHHGSSIRFYAKNDRDFNYGYTTMGGIAGLLQDSNATNCYNDNTGTMAALADTAYPRYIMGGFLVGDAYGTDDSTYLSDIRYCYNACTGFTYNTQYAGTWCAGGLLGNADSYVNLRNSYYLSTGNGVSFRGVYYSSFCEGTLSPTGTTLTKLKTQSNYSGFDFSGTWKMGSGAYPYAVLRNVGPHTHSLTKKAAVSYTCTKDGTIASWYCSGCDTHFRDSSGKLAIREEDRTVSARHTMGSWTVTAEPTCTQTGLEQRKCTACGHTEEHTLPVISHSFTTKASIHVSSAATCTLAATYYVQCDHCEAINTGLKISAGEPLGHDFAAYISDNNAGCTQDGTKTATCSRCDETDTVIEEGSASGHNYTTEIVPPTCTTEGYTQYHCPVCGDSYAADHVSVLGHSFTKYKSNNDASCTADETKTAVCDRCPETDTIVVENSRLGHDWTDWEIIDPVTCTADGQQTRRCSRCGETETQTIKTNGHDYKATVTEPDCLKGGYTTHHCQVCGNSYTDQQVSALGHDYQANVTPPSCTEAGYTTYTCLRCGHSYTDDMVSASGHQYSIVVTPPTCTAAGHSTYTCDVCKNSFLSDYTSALGHSWDEGSITVHPTEETEGQIKYTCLSCGGQRFQALPKLEHTHKYSTQTINPTCLEPGFTLHTCPCGDSYKTDETDALGHQMGDWIITTEPTCVALGKQQSHCSLCSYFEEDTVSATGKHLFEHYVSNQDATCTADGTKTATCISCTLTDTVTDTGSKLPHSYESVVTLPTCSEEGFTTYLCRCGDTYTADRVPAAGHTERVLPAVEAKCTASGLTQGMDCSVCGTILTAQTVVQPKGHSFGSWTQMTAPTCENDGKQSRSCGACGETETKPVKATGHHSVTDPAVAATCTSSGRTEGAHCDVCHTILKAQSVVPPLPHQPETDAAVGATCTQTGLTEGSHCAVCHLTLTAQKPVPATGHTPETDAAQAATCTTTGLTEGSHCAICSAIINPQTVIPATGHQEEILAGTKPTCTVTGLSSGIQCSICGSILKAREVIPATGHTVVTKKAVAPTCGKDGRTEGSYCYTCGTVLQVQSVIPATGKHTYSDKYDTSCNGCGMIREVTKTTPMYRMYDPNSSEHFYTGSIDEREILVKAGWNYEGVGFNFPVSGEPVHRLYEPITGEHLYTMDETEMDTLLSSGWNYEGVAFNSAGKDEVPQYRLHNPNASRGAYHFTGSTEERDLLISLGWEYQGIGWYSCLK